MTRDDPEPPDGRSDRDLVPRLAEDTPTMGSLLGDLYRGEVNRMTVWRSRLDQTTRWAVIVVAAILTWTFSSQDNPHYVLLIGMFAVTAFLLIEAHRYREYDIWRMRVQLLQKHVFVGVLSPQSSREADWQARLSESLSAPRFRVSFTYAVGHRLRRMYLALLSILSVAWVTRITAFRPNEPWRETAAVAGIGGEVVVTLVGLFYVAILVVTLWSVRGGGVREFRD